uniref:Uncharacterized protein n=1 Tax=Rhizophora mucronata TaxID=61149 RepID=A0A2P2R3Y2_RHIMU
MPLMSASAKKDTVMSVVPTSNGYNPDIA